MSVSHALLPMLSISFVLNSGTACVRASVYWVNKNLVASVVKSDFIYNSVKNFLFRQSKLYDIHMYIFEYYFVLPSHRLLIYGSSVIFNGQYGGRN